MASSSDAVLTLTSTSICALLIIARCIYRFTVRCNIHSTCHRRWRIDDFYMTVAILPLIGRALCILYSFLLNPNHTYEPGTSDAVNAERELSHKLLIPARIFYALLYESQSIEGGYMLILGSLWCLKLGLLAFYSRFIDVFRWGKIVTDALWWFIIATFIAVFITILAECRPISLYVHPNSSSPIVL